MSHLPGLIINPKFYVCTNEECPIGIPHWAEMGKPSGCMCHLCGQETRETKSEPLDTPQYAKSKGGRPTLSDEANVKVEIVMPASLRDKLDRLAPNGNRSAWIRQAIEAA